MSTRVTAVSGQRVMAVVDQAVQQVAWLPLLACADQLQGPINPCFLALKTAADRLILAVNNEEYDIIEEAGQEVEDATAAICLLLKSDSGRTIEEELVSLLASNKSLKSSPSILSSASILSSPSISSPSIISSLPSVDSTPVILVQPPDMISVPSLNNPANQQQQQQQQKNTPLERFQSMLGALRDCQHTRLTESYQLQRDRAIFFDDMVAKEKKMSTELKALVAQLAEARQQRERDSASRKTQLTKLREELRDMRETTINEAKILEKETTSREAFDLANFTESENAKKEELQALQKNLEDKGSLNKKKELMLRKKKARVEKELENWITKYDQEMEEKESELAALRQEYERELKELKETEDAYDKLLKERETFATEHRRNEAQSKREKSKKKRLSDAAMVIQRAWKRFQVSKKVVLASTSTKQLKTKTLTKSLTKSSKSLKGSQPLSRAPSKPGPATAVKAVPKPKTPSSPAKPTKQTPKKPPAKK